MTVLTRRELKKWDKEFRVYFLPPLHFLQHQLRQTLSMSKGCVGSFYFQGRLLFLKEPQHKDLTTTFCGRINFTFSKKKSSLLELHVLIITDTKTDKKSQNTPQVTPSFEDKCNKVPHTYSLIIITWNHRGQVLASLVTTDEVQTVFRSC